MNSISLQSARSNPRLKGFILALLGAILMSLDPVFIRYAGVSGFDTAFLFGLFTAISASIMLQVTSTQGIINAVKHSGWPVLAAGILMLISSTALVFSIKMTSITNTFVILSATPALAAVFSWLLLREVVNRSTIITIATVMLGIAIVVSGSFETGNWKGDALAVFSVTSLALMFTLLRKYKGISRIASVALGGIFISIVMFFFATPSSYGLNTWIIMGLMGLFTAPLGRVLSMTATRFITSAEVSMTLMIETILAAIWGLVFFSEIPPAQSIVGGSLIMIAIFSYVLHSAHTDNSIQATQ